MSGVEKVAKLRAAAEKREAEAQRIHGAANQDYAFWTQPAGSNAAGRAFARQRDRERGRLQKAGQLFEEAKSLRQRADSVERYHARVPGAAAAARAAAIEACAIKAGDMVETTFFGVRKVLKVNRISVLVEGSFGPLKVGKEFVRSA